MKKTLVIYSSSYGSTKRYANMIAEELSCEVIDLKDFKDEQLSHYDIIIYGGGLYASGIRGIKFLNKKWQLLKDKNIFVFTVGLSDPTNLKNVENIKEGFKKSVSEEIYNSVSLYHLRGYMDYEKLGFMHKTMMKMLRSSVSKKEEHEMSDEDKVMLQTYGTVVDFIDPIHYTSMLTEIKKSR